MCGAEWRRLRPKRQGFVGEVQRWDCCIDGCVGLQTASALIAVGDTATEFSSREVRYGEARFDFGETTTAAVRCKSQDSEATGGGESRARSRHSGRVSSQQQYEAVLGDSEFSTSALLVRLPGWRGKGKEHDSAVRALTQGWRGRSKAAEHRRRRRQLLVRRGPGVSRR